MRSALASVAEKRANLRQRRQRSQSISTVPPATTDDDYLPALAAVAASILYKSPRPSQAGLPVYILNAAAFPDAYDVDYDTLLPYVLARLPGEDELLSGQEYEVVFFAGGQPDGATSDRKQGPGIGWYLQAYHVLSRATRKKLQKLYIVHPRTWVRVLVGVFGTIVSPKFRRKIITVNTLSMLALHVPIEKLLIPPAVYVHDRKLAPDIYVPFATGKRAYGARHPFPKDIETGETRLPRVLRETTSFLLQPENLATEGLFRIPPHSVISSALKEAYDRGQEWIIWKERGEMVVQPGLDASLRDEIRADDTYGVHVAASLIKTWYRELRAPIFHETSYTLLRDKFGNVEEEVTPEDLVDLLLPASDNSPLTVTSREILSRHLLPLLSVVATHEPENKMTPEALGICFAMTLLCGSNQLEDARMTSVIKRILEAAINMWPQLRIGMGIADGAFERDLRAPTDLRNYEDPLERPQSRPTSQMGVPAEKDGEFEEEDGHRVALVENLEVADSVAPPLPPRRQRAHSTQQSPPPLDTSITNVPKRKPAPPVANPPRYSTVFDQDGVSIHAADSPVSYAPADGFAPPRRGDWSMDGDHKKVLIDPFVKTERPLSIEMPKRKAVANDASATSSREASGSDGAPSSMVARAAAQMAASGLAQRLVEQQTPAPLSNANGTEGEATAQEDGSRVPDSAASDSAVFRKPSWPASAARQASYTLAKPILPLRSSNTIPLISQPSPSNGDSDATAVHPVGVPRHRAPSPGLMKRIATMEPTPSEPMVPAAGGSDRHRLQPRAHGSLHTLKKASVEDLRRLYEERASTAEGLKRAVEATRGSGG